MKKDDVVYCIKNRDNLNIKGKNYKIIEIDYNINTIRISIEKSDKFIVSHFKIHKYDDSDDDVFFMFNTYFDTIKNIRKNKLIKLKNE